VTPLAWPLPGETQIVTTPFGYVPGYPGPGNFHLGLDLRAVLGTPVSNVGPGYVDFADWNGGYGWCVICRITLSDGEWEVRHGHLQRFNVVAGQKVSPGDIVGFADSTGHSTGNHLHWEVRRPGSYPVDPANWRLTHTLEEDMTEDETNELITARLLLHNADNMAHRSATGSVTIHAVTHEGNPESHRSPTGSLTAFNAEHFRDDHQYLAQMRDAMKAIRRRSEEAVRDGIRDFWVKLIRRNVVVKIPPLPGETTPEPTVPGPESPVVV